MKKQIIIVSTVIILMVLVLLLRITFNYPRFNFSINTADKYIVTTDAILHQTNGIEPYYSRYYYIDFNKNIIIKLEDKYTFMGSVIYKGKFLKIKLLNNKSKKELKTLLDKVVIDKEGTKKPKEYSYHYYKISSYNESDINLYDEKYIQKFIELLE